MQFIPGQISSAEADAVAMEVKGGIEWFFSDGLSYAVADFGFIAAGQGEVFAMCTETQVHVFPVHVKGFICAAGFFKKFLIYPQRCAGDVVFCRVQENRQVAVLVVVQGAGFVVEPAADGVDGFLFISFGGEVDHAGCDHAGVGFLCFLGAGFQGAGVDFSIVGAEENG